MEYIPEEYEPQEHDELAAKVFVMIKEEVVSKIKGTVEGLEYSRKRNCELQGEIYKLRQEIKNFESEKQKALKSKEKEVIRSLFGGFERGDKIFFTDHKWESKLCAKCNGEKKLTAILNGLEEKVRCPNCDGSGSIHGGYYIPKEDTIRTISLEINEHAKHYNFWLQRQDSKVGIESVFKTIEECQISCEEKNKPKVVKV